jgi:hypothetical protein
VSLPAHLFAWDAKRAATFRVLAYLWQFGDRESGDVWCFHADAQIIASCGLSNERQLRRCLVDLDAAGLVKRELGPDRKRGFRLFNKKPIANIRSEVTEAVRSDRSDLTAKAVTFDRNHYYVSLKNTTLSDQPFVLTPTEDQVPQVAPKSPKPRKGQLTDELAAELLALQNSARAATAKRIGRATRGVSLTPGIRKAMQARLRDGYTPDQLRQAMRARERTEQESGFKYLGTASCWAAKSIEFALGIGDDEHAVTARVPDATGWVDID